MKHLIVVILFFVFFPVALQAQSNYKSGFVVTTAGDTLKGFINYQEWHQAPTSFTFKTSVESDNKREFDASTAQYIEITGLEAYRRYEGPITMNEVELSRISGSRDLQITPAKVFMKELYTGENVSLLSYTDQTKTRYFTQEKNDSIPRELYFAKYYSSESKTLTMKSYVGQLLAIASRHMETTPALRREIEAAAYNAAPLQSIVSKINRKSDTKSESDIEGKNKFRFYAGGGLSRTTVQFGGENNFTSAEHNPASYMPRLVFGLDGFINRNTQRLILRAEGSLSASSHHIKKNYQSNSGTSESSYEIAQQTVSITPQVIYNLYNKDSFKFYLGGGFSVNFSNYSTNKSSYTYISSGSGTTYGPTEHQSYILESVWTSFMVRSGVILNKKYEISASYQPSAPLTKYFNFAVEHRSLSLGVNYLFNK